MDTDISCFDNILDILQDDVDEINVVVENRRSFHEYDSLLKIISVSDIVIVNDVKDLGNNNVDILNRLDWFIQKGRMLVINTISSTYMFGVGQPMNKAVLSTLVQSLATNDSNVVRMSKKPVVGRNKIEFPENWDELFAQWDKHEISSKEFLAKSGLKKATFYNMITEYREIQKINDDYIKRYKHA